VENAKYTIREVDKLSETLNEDLRK